MKKSFLFILIIGITSCASVETSTSIITPFFDTELFLDAEFPSSDLKMKSIKKTISYNGLIETTEIESYDISDDLDLLKSYNINNPSWSDKYSVDSTDISGGQLEVTYTSLDPKMKITSIKTYSVDSRVIGFEVHVNRDALISSSAKTISYQSNQGYKLTTDNKGIATDDRSIVVEVSFNPS